MFLSNADIFELNKNGTLENVLGDGFFVFESCRGVTNISGITSAKITSSKHPLSDLLKDVLERQINNTMQLTGPNCKFSYTIYRFRNVLTSDTGFKNWLNIERYHNGPNGLQAVKEAMKAGLASNKERFGPHVKILGFDNETKEAHFEFMGETRFYV